MRRHPLMMGTLAIATLGLAMSCGGGGGYGGGSSGSSYNNGGGSGTPPTVPPNTVLVGIDGTSALNMTFYPSSLTVAAGTTVTWKWATGAMTHNVTSGTAPSGDGAYFSPNQNTGTFTHTFTTAGTYPYFCSIHGAAMSGTITVN